MSSKNPLYKVSVPSTDFSKLSRAASHALRHEPWLYELEFDDEGWASVESTLVALKKVQPEWAD